MSLEITTSVKLAVVYGVFIAATAWLFYQRSRTFLMFFQQEEYDGARFTVWLKSHRLPTAFYLFTALAAGILLLGSTASFSALILLYTAYHVGREASKLGAQSKKPLVVTERAKRIWQLAGILLGLGLTAFLAASLIAGVLPGLADAAFIESPAARLLFGANLAVFVASVYLAPYLLVLANTVLAKREQAVKDAFRREAVEKLAKLQPTIVAITGSYGKTTTKHILHHILQSAAPTLMTPGSVNTDMGITRIVRERLTAQHTYFIVEMGAYGPGSIARLCALTPPHVGLITAVGQAHYERFKTIETVASAKFELAEAVAKSGGPVTVSTDAIPTDLLLDRISHVPARYAFVGRDTTAARNHQASQQTNSAPAAPTVPMVPSATIVRTAATASGTEVELRIGSSEDGASDETITLVAPLYGPHQADNMALAAMTAHTLGVPWNIIRSALASTPQITHRLEVKTIPGGPVIIDDAYNSNPTGFKSALDTLSILSTAGSGKRMLITPGMVELGDANDSAHKDVGRYAAAHVDTVLLVTPQRFKSFEEGLQEGLAALGRTDVTVMHFNTQSEAEAWAKANWQAGDVVLFENNLPDLYEQQSPRF